MRRVRIPGWLLLVAFVVVPLVEIFVLIQVGQVIGAWWTILLLVADGILGTWLIRREGSRSWAALREALQTGRMPARELTDAGLILVGGTLMLTPGFVSDLLGILLILPVTRPVARRLLTRTVASRLLGTMGGGVAGPMRPGRAPGDARRPGPGPEGPVVRGEVVDDD
ncbi:FxsA family protein [Nocardioides sp. P5_C9_2]